MRHPQYADAIAGLKSAMDRALAGRRITRVLEAGCGSATYVPIPDRARLTGIDISAKQLARNAFLDASILGDIQTYPLPGHSYDIVICWDVLEHLPRPRQAMENLLRSVRPEGLLVLAVPNLLSAKGLLTKVTPHCFHVWVRRVLFGERDAGRDEFGPFPTFLRRSITPRALRSFAVERGLLIDYFCIYESRMHVEFKDRHPFAAAIWISVAAAVSVLSLGRVSAWRTDIILLLRTPPGDSPATDGE
jgi:SAM-dependent methyltransferase